ncbi:hypothetical protein JTB14_029918 [Gonioctena quinquepunctata]|nr:hypothetical protein JTB14_029918 [Gonioctena quinquepunctata]
MRFVPYLDLKNVCIVIEEYLEKYAEMTYAAHIGSIEENKENSLSVDLSNFSIGSEFVGINSSSPMLQTSIQDVSVEMEEFVDINSSSYLMMQTSIQVATVEMEDEKSIGDNKLSESPTGFSDNSIDDPIFEPDEGNECSSEQSDLADEPTSLNSKNNISTNLLERSINTTINTCDDGNLVVSVSKASRKGEKIDICVFCHKKQTKLARHLETVHKSEDEVEKFKNLPKGCKERIGDHWPLEGKGAEHRCIVTGKNISARLHCTANKMVRETLFPPLREDDIVRLIKYDELVIVYANKMCEKYRNERYCEMIRQRLRLIGRFSETLKEINKYIQNLTDVFDPKYCENTIRVINRLGRSECGYWSFRKSYSCFVFRYLTEIHIENFD